LLPLRCGIGYLKGELVSTRFCIKIKRDYAQENHMYLAVLAVDPVYHGKGYASALIKPMLKRLDETRVPCYLKTHNPKNVSMYQHFGFKLVFEGNIPRTSSPIFALLKSV
jgi:ribosomal protein S18 acetylase RimI-like enzyme